MKAGRSPIRLSRFAEVRSQSYLVPVNSLVPFALKSSRCSRARTLSTALFKCCGRGEGPGAVGELFRSNGTLFLTGTKYDWLRTSANLDNSPWGSACLPVRLAGLNLKTARAWRIKETATLLWNFTYEAVAVRRYQRTPSVWCRKNNFKPMVKVGKMIRSFFLGEYLNAIKLKTSNTMLESINSGIPAY